MNLLPLKQVKRVRLEIFYQNIVFSGLILILLVLILILILGGFLVFLNFKYQDIEKQITIEQSRVIQTETVRGMERKVKELNKDLTELREILKKRKYIYQILDNISRDLLGQVEVRSIEIDSNSGRIRVSGYSDTRDKLLVIKQILEEFPQYKDIDFPVSNLTSSKDIDFFFSFTYNYEY